MTSELVILNTAVAVRGPTGKELGEFLASCGSNDQAQALNWFAASLENLGRERREAQLCWIGEELTPTAIEFLKAIAEFGLLSAVHPQDPSL